MAQSNAQRTETGDQRKSETRQPVYTAKVGSVEIPVWENEGSNGNFYTASSPNIRYKEEKSGEWKDGSSYSALDLLALAEAARDASAKIRELKGKSQNR